MNQNPADLEKEYKKQIYKKNQAGCKHAKLCLVFYVDRLS